MDHDDRPVGHILTRRQALSLIGAPAFLWLAGCSRTKADDGIPGVPGTGPCVARPEMTEGPFYIDTDLVRSDIRGGREGALLALTFNVSRLRSNECSPLEGAVVDVWHADALGNYSGVGSYRSQNFLRGIQTTGADGVAAFTTIYPGWYRGRAVHIHYKVRSAASSDATYEFTSQLFFDDELSKKVYRQAPYHTRGPQDVLNARDGIYARAGDPPVLLDVVETDAGYAAPFDIALYTD